MTSTIDTYKDTHRSYWLPVDDPRHTSVLGNHCTGKYGKADWERLNWDEWWIDGSECNYFHVPLRDVPGDPADGRVYRVRCWYTGGTYRRWPIRSIGIGLRDGKLHWIVRTIKPGCE